MVFLHEHPSVNCLRLPFEEDANFGGLCVAALSDHLSVFLEEGSSGGFIHRPTLALPSAAGAAGVASAEDAAELVARLRLPHRPCEVICGR